MGTHTVVIGCEGVARAAAVEQAITARIDAAVKHDWPDTRALATGADVEADVVVLDGYPSGAGLRAMAELTSTHPTLNVLVLAPLESGIDLFVALSSGAVGYLPATSPLAAIADGVAALLMGDAVLPRAVSIFLVKQLRWGGRGIVVDTPDGRSVELTNREWEIFVLLRQERTTAEIAKRLVVSNGTVRSHVASLLHKFGARDRAVLVPLTASAGV